MAVDVEQLVVVVVVVMVLMPMAWLECFGTEPALDIDAFGLRVVEAEIKQQGGIDGTLRHGQQRGAGVEGGQPHLQSRRRARSGKIGLGQQQPVGHCGLLDRFELAVEGGGSVDRVDRRYHPIERVARGDQRVRDQRMQDWRGVGEPGRLDHHATEMGDLAIGAPDKQVQQGVDDVASHGAA